METLIKTFHIELPLLLAQGANFLIVFLVLWFFALKPLLKTMKERTQTIEKSLEDAKAIEKNLTQSQADYEAKIAEARKEAGEIRTRAGEEAEQKKQEMIEAAKEEIHKLISGAKAQIKDEKHNMMREIQNELAGIIALALEKVLDKKIDTDEDKKNIEQALKNISFPQN